MNFSLNGEITGTSSVAATYNLKIALINSLIIIKQHKYPFSTDNHKTDLISKIKDNVYYIPDFRWARRDLNPQPSD